MSVDRDEHWMRIALDQANAGREAGEVPVGAVLVKGDTMLAAAYNAPVSAHDPTAHAEIMAMRIAANTVGNYRLPGTTLYVTIEPCAMCAGALVHARVARLVYGAREPRAGVVHSRFELLGQPWLNHTVEVTGGVLEQECSALITGFFASRRRPAIPSEGE